MSELSDLGFEERKAVVAFIRSRVAVHCGGPRGGKSRAVARELRYLANAIEGGKHRVGRPPSAEAQREGGVR